MISIDFPDGGFKMVILEEVLVLSMIGCLRVAWGIDG
jgi:hypothetical protein